MDNFNDKIDVSLDARGIAGRKIVCRHFATAFANDPQALHHFRQGEESIRSYFEQRTLREIETSYNQYIRAPENEKALVSKQRFGAWLERQASSMDSARANALVNTADHTVAVVIEKNDTGHPARFDATFYDPNRTLAPVVHRNQDLSQLAKLTFRECFPEVIQHPVPETDRGITVTAFTPGRQHDNSCEFVDFAQAPGDARNYCFGSTLYAALQFNMAEAVEPIKQQIVAAARQDDTAVRRVAIDSATLLRIGASLNEFNGKGPALAAAERDGGAEVFSKVPGLCESLEMDGSQACRFLSAEHEGRPCLQHAARHGDLSMVRAITDAIVGLEKIYEIEDYVPTLLQGLPVERVENSEQGPDPGDSGETHTSDDEQSHASDDEQTRAGDDDDPSEAKEFRREAAETPALHLAAYNGHTGMYKIIADAMVKLDLPKRNRMEILAACDSDGRPALCRAMATERFDCFDALARAGRTSELDRDQTLELLIATEPTTGLAAHQLAVKLGTTEGCDRLVRALVELDVAKEKIVQALMNGTPNGPDTRALCAENPQLTRKLDHILNRIQLPLPGSPQRRPGTSGEPGRRPVSPTSETSVSKRQRR